MAENDMDQPSMPATTAAPASGDFLKRELNGATFLTFEHVTHMVLVVVVTALLVCGMTALLSQWTGGNDKMGLSLFMGDGLRNLEAMAMVWVAAGLILLTPILVVVDRRTRAEWQKRRGYSGRVAYKLPIYSALGVLMAGKIASEVVMLSVVLNSLLMMGVQGVDVGDMYLHQFLPALISAIMFAGAAWYVFKLAKGRDSGRQFSMATAVVAVAVVVAVLVTAFNVYHTKTSNPTQDYLDKLRDNSSLYDSLFDY